MTEEEIAWLDIETLHAETTKGSLSASQITEAFLSRIERLDPSYQAFASVYPDRARASAARLDRQQAAGEPLGPLHGVAVALKDLCDVAGEPTRAGTTALGDVPAEENACVVDRLEGAGAIVLGKVKMTEGAFIEHHASVVPPKNPWNAERWTGISSSGSGVAVAAGLCTVALGTDTGGSIRYPSAACGLSGLKPTHGRVSLRGVYPLADSLDHIGPMARSASDAARVFSVLAGHDPRDPWSRPEEAVSPIHSSPSSETGMSQCRFGYDARFCEEDIDPGIVAALQSAIQTYRDLGAEIIEFEMPGIDEALGAWLALGSAEIANAHAATYPSKREEYGAGLAATIETGQAVSGLDVAKAWRARLAFARRFEGCFHPGSATRPKSAPEGLDAVFAPVIPGRFPANANLGDPGSLPHGGAAMRFTSPFNLSGSPSLTMCGGFDRDGAPIGFQIIGALGADERLLRFGRAYQEATGHHARHPL